MSVDVVLIDHHQHQDVPGVGRNLQDHIATGLDLIVLNQTVGTKPSEILTPANLINYLHHGEGPLTSGGCEALGFDEETKGLGYMFLPVGLSTDRGFHLRKIMNIKPTVWKDYFQKFTETTTVSIIPIVLQPKSRGFLKLAKGQIDSDSDFNDEPIVSINPKYLQEQQDVEKLITGIQRLSAIIDDNLKTFGGKLNPLPLNECKGHSFGSRFYWECYIRQISFSVYHPVGTCRMGNKRQKDTVVDYHTFKVLGMENFYENLPSGNPNAAVGMLAKKFVDTLLDGEKLKKK
uniref:Glucose-methanol-choline oxidoreductase C-terminal domain-containing protein n=1 Tax=Megaselia scalaris TaxID=36166 RepID=T1GUJ6_MEGSC